jgi:hypothetical protein
VWSERSRPQDFAGCKQNPKATAADKSVRLHYFSACHRGCQD